MNEFSIVNKYIIDHFDNDNLVNTISIVPTFEMDANKENIYPLVNVDLRGSDIQEQAIIFSFRITIVNQRDIRPIKIDSKLLSNTNYEHNINETHSIATRFTNVLTGQNNIDNIEMQSLTNISVKTNWGINGLDGVQFDIELSVPNKGKSC